MTMAAEGMQMTKPVTVEDVLAELRALRDEIRAVRRMMPQAPMSPAEFAAAIGKSKKTVERWIASGKLRVKRTGRVTLIRPVDAERFMDGVL
jgi:excisionase family DNA binding protein